MNLTINGSVSNTGYGIATKCLMLELEKLGVNVSLIPKGGLSSNSDFEEARINEMASRRMDMNAPFLKIWHQHELLDHMGRGTYIGFPIFELDTFNEQELFSLQCPDHLMVCSKWAFNVIKQTTGRESAIVNLGVDPSVFFPTASPKSDTYRFFNIGKWEKRKGHDVLHKCFDSAFTHKDDVELHLMPYNPFIGNGNEYWKSKYKNSRLGDKIKFHSPVKYHSHVAAFINSCDCGVFPARAEGWNMELLESMACGKPVITTNYSAHTEYCTKENAFLVEPENGLELAVDNIWFHGQGNWMNLDFEEEDQIVEYMRFCYKNRPFNQEGVKTANRFTWAKSASDALLYLKNFGV